MALASTWSLFLIFGFVTISCTFGASSPTLYDLAGTLGCDKFITFVNVAGLQNVLNGTERVTLFAPVDSAFNALPANVIAQLSSDTNLLRAVINYHITKEIFNSTTYVNEMTLPSMEGADIRINAYAVKPEPVITASGGMLLVKNAQASNGVMQVIDKVMFPLPNGTVGDLVSRSSTLNTLLLACSRAGLLQSLSGKHPMTLFAPTDDAFSKLPPGDLSMLLSDITKLRDVLRYHIVEGTYYSAGLTNDTTLTTLNNGKLKIEITASRDVLINGARANTADVSVSNGVVYYIDDVLIPPPKV